MQKKHKNKNVNKNNDADNSQNIQRISSLLNLVNIDKPIEFGNILNMFRALYNSKKYMQDDLRALLLSTQYPGSCASMSYNLKQNMAQYDWVNILYMMSAHYISSKNYYILNELQADIEKLAMKPQNKDAIKDMSNFKLNQMRTDKISTILASLKFLLLAYLNANPSQINSSCPKIEKSTYDATENFKPISELIESFAKALKFRIFLKYGECSTEFYYGQ